MKKPQCGNTEASENEINFEEEIVMSNISTAVSNVIPFAFEAKSVRVQDIGGSPWFCVTDVCSILGYSNSRDAMAKHCREKGVAKRDTLTSRGKQALTFIDEGNLYRLIIKSRKEEAVRFESWVCDDVLPAIRKHGHYVDHHSAMGDLVGAVIGTSGENVLDRVIDQKASPVPHSLQRSFKHTMKSRLRSRFNVQRTALIPAENLSDACNFVVAYALEGEWIGRDSLPSDKVKWPAQRWLQESPEYVQRTMTEMQGRGNMMLTPHMLFGDDSASPTLRAISELEKQGHDLEACRFEVQALKHHLEGARNTIQSLQMLIERSDGKGVRFPMAQPGHAA